MNGTLKVIIAIFAILSIIGVLGILVSIGTYNGLVSADQDVQTQWAIVESKYQRRVDLIPNMVEVVKGITKQEQAVFIEVAKARSQWSNAKSPEDKLAAASGIDSAISRLLMVQENYPQLKSNENFLALQAELSGTENRISVERDRYNEKVRDYNLKVRSFPSSIFAGMFGFKEKAFYKADAGSENAPKVNFSN
ncbi:MAG: LemA family protein [Candidatus Methanoperedens sp.]|nr:LemA family protein [Candidatus Methanoperedens sp.]MCE8429184.1 LemA family protein [Candidatus Methanoperedens sp.]